MPKVRMIYYSQALQDMSLGDIQNILKTARSNNKEQNICGMLCYESRWFLQVLEGDREVLNELFLEIADDPRHDSVVIVSYEYVDETLFSDWQMGYAGSSGGFKAALSELNLLTFTPVEMQPDQCLAFLKLLSFHQDSSA